MRDPAGRRGRLDLVVVLEAEFAFITAANELDLVRRDVLEDEWRQPVADLLDRLAGWVGPPRVITHADAIFARIVEATGGQPIGPSRTPWTGIPPPDA